VPPHLRVVAAEPAGRPAPVDLAETANQAFAYAAGVLPPAIRVSSRGLDGPPRRIAVHPIELRRLIVTLLMRSAEAMDGTGVITVALSDSVLDDATALRLGVPPGPYAVLNFADGVGPTVDRATLTDITALVARWRGAIAIEPGTSRRGRLAVYVPIAGQH